MRKKDRKVRERAGKGTLVELFVGGEPGGRDSRGERQREGERDERILIRNLKNKIIRLSDSKCQLREGSRWRGREGDRKEGRERR